MCVCARGGGGGGGGGEGGDTDTDINNIKGDRDAYKREMPIKERCL